MNRPLTSRIPRPEGLVLGFLLFSVLWRGGKSLEATWLLVGLAGALILVDAVGKNSAGSREQGAGSSVPLWCIAMGFVFWTSLSYFFSATRNYGLDEVLRDGSLVLIFLWTMRHAHGEVGVVLVHRFVQTMVIAAVLAAAFGLLVYVLQPVNRFVGTFFDYRFHTDYWPNAWAQFVLLAWPVILLWTRQKMGRLRVTGYGLLGLFLGTLLLSYSRGAMIAFGGQLVLLVLWEWKNRKFGTQSTEFGMKYVKVALIAVTAIAVFFAANAVRSGFHPVQSVGEKITFTADEGGSSVSERQQFWRQALALTIDRPLFGWGPYSFRFVQQRLQTGALQTSDHPHNVFLKLASERGMPAVILLISLFMVILYPAIRLQIANCKSPSMQSAMCNQSFLIIAVLGVLAHNLIDYNLQFVGIALPFWIMLGMLAAGARSGKLETARTVLNKKLVRNVELAIAVILLSVAIREGAFLVSSSLGRHAEAAGDTEAALWWYNRSAPEWFSRDMHLSRALLGTLSNRTGTAREAIDTFLDSNREDPRGWRLKGDIAKTKGDLEGAIDAYGKAYEFGRWNDVSIALALAEALRENEQLEMSNEQLSLAEMKSEIDALLGSFVEAIVQNAHFVALSHNAEDAIALANLLAERFPDSAPRYEVLAAKADFAMKTERAKIRSRPSGYLW